MALKNTVGLDMEARHLQYHNCSAVFVRLLPRSPGLSIGEVPGDALQHAGADCPRRRFTPGVEALRRRFLMESRITDRGDMEQLFFQRQQA